LENSFVLDRTVTNWNTTVLEARIRTLLAALKYKGNLEITFPITQTKLVVVAPPATSDDYSPFIRIGSTWPYANKMGEEPASLDDGAEEARLCTAQSEEKWWEIWNGAIAVAVMGKKTGLVEIKDVILRALEGGLMKFTGPAEEWGMNE
jgi:hypothetical protein